MSRAVPFHVQPFHVDSVPGQFHVERVGSLVLFHVEPGTDTLPPTARTLAAGPCIGPSVTGVHAS